MRAAVAFLLMGLPCHAEPWIDYDLLFQQNAERITVSTSAEGVEVRSIDFGNGITVSCGELGCWGLDANGAIGCVWVIYSELLAAARACDVREDKVGRLPQDFEQLTAFVAQNAVPPRSIDEISAIHNETIARLRRDDAAQSGEICRDVLAPESDVQTMLEQLTKASEADEGSSELQKLLSTPRLPVANPCL